MTWCGVLILVDFLLEQALGNVEKVIFDKTGTLTNGQFSVAHLENIGDSYSRTEM